MQKENPAKAGFFLKRDHNTIPVQLLAMPRAGWPRRMWRNE